MSLGNQGSIAGWLIRKTQKMLVRPCITFNIIRYESKVRGSSPGNGVTPSPTPWCSSYWKGSLRVTLDESHQLYFISPGISFIVNIWQTDIKILHDMIEKEITNNITHISISTMKIISLKTFISDFSGTLAQRLECSPMARETWVQSQVESYQRL